MKAKLLKRIEFARKNKLQILLEINGDDDYFLRKGETYEIVKTRFKKFTPVKSDDKEAKGDRKCITCDSFTKRFVVHGTAIDGTCSLYDENRAIFDECPYWTYRTKEESC